MTSTGNLFSVSSAIALLAAAVGPALAQNEFRSAAFQQPSLALAFVPSAAQQDKQPEAPQDEPDKPAAQEEPEHDQSEGIWGYRGVSSFFNIREANSNVERGEWEFELTFKWETDSGGESDEIEFEQSLKYGFTDRFHIELEIEEPGIGEGGGHGAGDLQFVFFYQFIQETEAMPALGGFAKMRVPSGDGSSGLDGTLSLMATKTFGEKFRVHFQGFVMSANGSSGAGGDDERRAFQWGVGPGFDFQLAEETLIGMNYLFRSSDDDGGRNESTIEFGLVQGLGHIGEAKHEVKFAFDVGLNRASGTPNYGAKLLWGIEW